MPTLFIIGGNDDRRVIEVNNKALSQLVNAQKKKVITNLGATHLFEEPGALEEVARLQVDGLDAIFSLENIIVMVVVAVKSSNNYNNNMKRQKPIKH